MVPTSSMWPDFAFAHPCSSAWAQATAAAIAVPRLSLDPEKIRRMNRPRPRRTRRERRAASAARRRGGQGRIDQPVDPVEEVADDGKRVAQHGVRRFPRHRLADGCLFLFHLPRGSVRPPRGAGRHSPARTRRHRRALSSRPDLLRPAGVHQRLPRRSARGRAPPARPLPRAVAGRRALGLLRGDDAAPLRETVRRRPGGGGQGGGTRRPGVRADRVPRARRRLRARRHRRTLHRRAAHELPRAARDGRARNQRRPARRAGARDGRAAGACRGVLRLRRRLRHASPRHLRGHRHRQGGEPEGQRCASASSPPTAAACSTSSAAPSTSTARPASRRPRCRASTSRASSGGAPAEARDERPRTHPGAAAAGPCRRARPAAGRDRLVRRDRRRRPRCTHGTFPDPHRSRARRSARDRRRRLAGARPGTRRAEAPAHAAGRPRHAAGDGVAGAAAQAIEIVSYERPAAEWRDALFEGIDAGVDDARKAPSPKPAR